MKKPVAKTNASNVIASLHTMRDFVRYAVTRFSGAGLFYGHGTFTALDEAIFLAMETLRLPVTQHPDPYLDARLLPEEKKALLKMIDTRVKTRKPLAYLLNKAYLQGFPFYVDERVIIPRSFIAELLFTDVIANEGYPLIEDPYEIKSVLDLCTGSGCLAVLAARAFPEAQIDAVDLSKSALEVARINVKDSPYAERITLHHGDLFKPMKGRRYDLIITNPPYVDAEAMKHLPEEYHYEPKMALAAGEDGLDLVRRILKEAPSYLTEEGRLLCEIGSGREILEGEYPGLPFLWLDTEESQGEVFWLTQDQIGVRS